jgi:site-specific DNA recombinase
LIWNRQRHLKDPDTGKREARINHPEARITIDVPHLQILDDNLWQAAKREEPLPSTPFKARVATTSFRYLDDQPGDSQGISQCGDVRGHRS